MKNTIALLPSLITVGLGVRLYNGRPFHLSLLGPEFSSVAWSAGGQLVIFVCFGFSVMVFDTPVISGVESSCRFIIVLARDLSVYRDDSLTIYLFYSKRVFMRTEQLIF